MKEFGFQWHITNLCNLRCRHCYQSDFTDDDDLSTDINKHIIKVISGHLTDQAISVNVTGGEPLLRPDIFDIFDQLDDTVNFKEYNIITNAIPLNEKKIKRLETCTKLRQVKISLECSDSELNDKIRGKGSFKKIMFNFELLKKLSTKQKVLMFTLGSYNYRSTPAMLDFSEKVGADAVILERFVPQGQGEAMKEHFLKKEEWHDVINAVITFAGLDAHPNDLIMYRAFYIDLNKNKDVHGAFCNLGDESMALMPNADVYPCRRTPVKIGNILSDDFGDILIRLKLLRESFDKSLKGKCGSCAVSGCIGCRALSHALTGDLYEEDRQCYLGK
ncbi:MAG TPA: radical SAM protein [bacterium]